MSDQFQRSRWLGAVRLSTSEGAEREGHSSDYGDHDEPGCPMVPERQGRADHDNGGDEELGWITDQEFPPELSEGGDGSSCGCHMESPTSSPRCIGTRPVPRFSSDERPESRSIPRTRAPVMAANQAIRPRMARSLPGQ